MKGVDALICVQLQQTASVSKGTNMMTRRLPVKHCLAQCSSSSGTVSSPYDVHV